MVGSRLRLSYAQSAKSNSGELALIDLKAVDNNYPMLGELSLAPQMSVRDLLAQRDGAFGAGADPILLARLGLKIGDHVTVGNANFQICTAIKAEPDKLASGVGLGPRFLVSEDALRATGLLQPGSLVRWVYRVRLPDTANTDQASQQLTDDAQKALPEAGWEIRSRSNASPQLERNITRFTQFLTLVGLAALPGGRRRRRQRSQKPFSTADAMSSRRSKRLVRPDVRCSRSI